MFNWFRKSNSPPDLSEANGDQAQWSLGKAKTEGGLLLIRRNQTAQALIGHPELAIKLGFAIPFGIKTEGDLPDAEENAEVSQIEDQIIACVAENTSGVHVLTLTNTTCKELIFYIKAGADIGSIHKRLMGAVTSHEVQCFAEHDRDWDLYRQFMPAVK